MTNATLSQYDQEFADAMALKLRLNRAQRSTASEASAKVPAPSDTNEGLSGISESIVRESMEDFPGLTREKAMAMLEAAGG
tara:strand:- start:120 stop:362 length:243 start_codon:yes stop_codon:yes gene_type:complete